MTSPYPHDYKGVALTTPVTIGYERVSTHGTAYFIGQALKGLCDAAGLKKSDIDGLALSSLTLKPDTVVGMTAYLGLSPRWIDDIPMGGASGVVALKRAARAIQMGDADIIACIAADATKPADFRDLVANFSNFSRDAVYPYGAAGPNMVFAMITRHYMETFGATREDFGRLCVSQRQNALLNPHAVLKKSLTLDDYMNARPVADPLHLFDCVMPCAGGEAFLVMSDTRAAELGLKHATIKSAVERHNAYPEDPIPTRGGWAMEADRLYGMAGATPEDMDFLQTYDDYPVISLLQMEDLGFCKKGEAAAFIRGANLTTASTAAAAKKTRHLPHNTSGGQLSAGQAGAAGGFLGTTEAIRQLTGDAGERQIEDARLGLVSGYGMVIYDRCLCTSAAILERGGL